MLMSPAPTRQVEAAYALGVFAVAFVFPEGPRFAYQRTS